MSTPVPMPGLGESVTEATVIRWLKAVGDHVAVDEPLVEVSTDKVDAEIPSPVAGTLAAIAAGEDDVVQVGAILAHITADGAAPTPMDQTVPFPPVGAVAQVGAVAPGSPLAALTSPAHDDAPHLSPAPASAVEATHSAPLTPSWLPIPDTAGAPGDAPVSVSQPTLASQPASPRVFGGSGAQEFASTRPPAPRSLAAPAAPRLTVHPADVPTEPPPPPPPPADGGSPAAPPAPAPSPTSDPLAHAVTSPSVSQPVAVTAPNPPVATMAYITPLVRKLAGQLGVDLTQVVGSGVGGRIRREDVEQEAARLEAERQAAEAARLEAERQAAEAARLEAERQAAEVARLEAERQAAEAARLEAERQAAEAARLAAHAPQPASTPTAAPAPSATPAAATPAAPTPGALALAAAGTSAFAAALPPAPTHPALTAYPTQPAQGATSAPATGPAEPDARRGTSEPLTWQRSAMAERMVSSLHATAQVTATAEVDVTRVAALIDAAAPAVLAREGIQLGFLPFFTVAAIEALQANPTLNATLEGDQIRYHAVENIAFTVDTPLGPVTPVVKNAGSLTLIDLARTVADLAARIHDNAIMPDELAGGTFTVTNPGSGDALFETPIVHEPQVAILSFGAIVKRPVVVTDPAAGDAIAVRSMAYLALSYDHRLVDGPDAGRFLAMVRHRIESGAFDIDLPTT